ncbi:putative transcription factor B3-Domain family [Medicago truncatula]|uniref:Putative transcription factor B3-Domain family n=1 Tax=Medicago truncatula TaxID=3880 RepID=A0A396IHE6_MEDTR|nr:B3 domain-containing protein REM8 [Medicago truncatula]RHN64281.1 putative transcription factor B3-Domain family [Medicago truncatula]
MSSTELDHRSNGVHFFKIILQRNLNEGKLKVPVSFVRRHWLGITNPVTLRLPNMTENKVFWEKTSDYNVWFCNGWKEFAKYLSLGDSQLTLFQYQENSVFNVIVCGKCGLEIKYPLKETNKEHEEVEESDTSLQIIEDPSSSKGKRLKSSPPYFKKMKINSKEQKEPKHEKRKVQEQGRFLNFKDTDNGSSCDDLKERSKVLYDKVKNFFHADMDFFMCMIQKTYIKKDVLGIPIEFAKKHLHRMEGRNITLFVDQDRPWNADLNLTLNNQYTLSGGWSKFRAHNNLKFGDICVFMLNKCKGTVSFQVKIFSLEKDMSTPYFEG